MEKSKNNQNNNTTKLVNALATLLPPLFLEARIFSGGKQIELVTQLGLSIPATQNMDIAIFTRTSGAAFAVGIGSFVAYKMLCRLIKSNNIWTALEHLSPLDEEQKYQRASVSNNIETVVLAEGFYAVRLGGENDLLRRLDEFLSTTTTTEAEERKQRVAVVQVRQANALRRLFRQNQHLNKTGISSIDQQINFNEKQKMDAIASRGDIVNYGIDDLIIKRRLEIIDDFEEDDDDIKSNLSDCQISCNTSASRAEQNNNNNNFSINCSSSSYKTNNSNKSVSLHLNCENELFWEDEFCNNEGKRREEEIEEDIYDEGLFLFREREGSLGGLSQLSAMKNLEKMFSNDWLNKNINEEEIEEDINDNNSLLLDNALNNLREMSSLDDVANTSASSLLNNTTLTEQVLDDYPSFHKEPRLSFTAYKIVLQNELSESSSSLCGGSTRSNKFGRYCCPSSPHRQQRKILDNASTISTSQGLWELTNNGTNSRLMSEKQCLKIYERKDRSNNNSNSTGLMVDSIISINSHASSLGISSQIQIPNSGMTDSAIGTDFQSSADDDDWKEQIIEEGEIVDNNTGITQLKNKSGVFRRFGGDLDSSKGIITIINKPLSKINESNTTTPVKVLKTKKSNLSSSTISGSESSLEWF